MPKFQCTLRQDACITWLVTVEAESAAEAARYVESAWGDPDTPVVFEQDNAIGYDDATCDPDDCEEVP